MIISNIAITPNDYTELLVENFRLTRQLDDYKSIKEILKEHGMDDDISYPLTETEKVVNSQKKFVLVDCKKLVERDYINYPRWFRLPDNIEINNDKDLLANLLQNIIYKLFYYRPKRKVSLNRLTFLYIRVNYFFIVIFILSLYF